MAAFNTENQKSIVYLYNMLNDFFSLHDQTRNNKHGAEILLKYVGG
jgi:hypothetical protein